MSNEVSHDKGGEKRLLSVSVVAKRLGVRRKQVYRYIAAGELDAVDISMGFKAVWKIDERSLDIFIERRRFGANRKETRGENRTGGKGIG